MAVNPGNQSHEELPGADVLLVAVTAVEVKALFAALGKTPAATRRHFGDKTYYDFAGAGVARTILVRSEMGSEGPAGSMLTIDEAVRAMKPAAVIMVGIAFGVDPERQRIGDILVSRQLLGYELQRVGMDARGNAKIVLRGDRPPAAPRLLDRFRDGELDWQGSPVKFGLVLSGSKLVDNIDFRDQLKMLVPEAIGGEMEGAGLYAAALKNKVDWILIKAICDFADGNKVQNKQANQELAAASAAGFVAHVLRLGGLARDDEAESGRSRETSGPGMQVSQSGNGAIAIGPGAVAAGKGGVAVGGDMAGSIIVTGNCNVISRKP